MASLLEMSADDFSARSIDPRTLATALVDMATTGWAPSCALSAATSDVSDRVCRLLLDPRTSKKASTVSALLAATVLAVPLFVAFAV
jgi:hypothetical protein